MMSSSLWKYGYHGIFIKWCQQLGWRCMGLTAWALILQGCSSYRGLWMFHIPTTAQPVTASQGDHLVTWWQNDHIGPLLYWKRLQLLLTGIQLWFGCEMSSKKAHRLKAWSWCKQCSEVGLWGKWLDLKDSDLINGSIHWWVQILKRVLGGGRSLRVCYWRVYLALASSCYTLLPGCREVSSLCRIVLLPWYSASSPKKWIQLINGLKCLQPWVKINLSSFKLFLSGICHSEEKSNTYESAFLARRLLLAALMEGLQNV
jgi:hypothetical protein